MFWLDILKSYYISGPGPEVVYYHIMLQLSAQNKGQLDYMHHHTYINTSAYTLCHIGTRMHATSYSGGATILYSNNN